jgi:hypothetical protein
MALARCELHPPQPGKKTYVLAVAAAGKGLVCGSDRCFNDAQVWMTATEVKDYQAGETVFAPDSAVAKFRVPRFQKATGA